MSCQVWATFDVTDKLKGNVSFQKHPSTETKRPRIMRKQDVMIVMSYSILAAFCVLAERENGSYGILLTTRSVAYFET